MSTEARERLVAELNRAIRMFIAGSSLYSHRIADILRMHPTDLQFLNILELLGPSTPAVLARYSGLTSGGVTVALDRLEKSGYVRRTPNPNDRRSVVVQIVPAKRRKVVSNYQSVQKQFDALVAGFSEDHLKTILAFFSAANTVRPNAPERR